MYARVTPRFFISAIFSGVYPWACIHCLANRIGEYQKAPSTKVRSAATRTARMLTLAVGIRAPLGSEGNRHGPVRHYPRRDQSSERIQVVTVDQSVCHARPLATHHPTTTRSATTPASVSQAVT